MKPGPGSWERGPGELILAARDALEGKTAEGPPCGNCGELFAAAPAAPPDRQEEDEALIRAASGRLRSFSLELYDLCLLSWMSSEDLEPLLLAVAREAGAAGPSIIFDYSRQKVRLLRRGCDRVEREIHRLAGLARFGRRSDGIYSAPLEPDHAVLPALARHFLGRFAGGDFAIVDCRRRWAVLSTEGQLHVLSGDEALELLPEDEVSEAEGLWKLYFSATENPRRRKPELQRRFMPERYWKYLTELRS